MSRVRKTAAVLLCLSAGIFALISVPRVVDELSAWTKPAYNSPWAGGQIWSVDTEYLDWIKVHVKEGESFHLIDGTGNIAIGQWAPYQLYPAVAVENPAEADWIVLYGVRSPDANLPPGFTYEEEVYLDGYSLLQRLGPEGSGGQ